MTIKESRERLHELSAGEREKVFAFLDDLRESGVTNMFGARPYIMREFGYDGAMAGALLSEWMRTFGERHKDAK